MVTLGTRLRATGHWVRAVLRHDDAAHGPLPHPANGDGQRDRMMATSAEPITSVLLATDLSATSSPAEQEALRLAAGLRARLIAVSVIDPGSLKLPGGRYRARVDQVRDEREMAAQALVARAQDLGVATAFLVWEGDPGEAIVDAASAEQADFIVLGTHGRHGVNRSFFGSVSDHVIRHAPCPVVVVRGTA